MHKPTVLIIDDDPSHLRIYGWIMQSAGFEPLSGPVTLDGVELPQAKVDLVLLDYHLKGKMDAAEIAVSLRTRYPGAPILILSDALMMPPDVAPLADGFVRKGDPARLVQIVSERLNRQPQ
ncbi:MAG TPA: response regulator [Acidobacteriaceae bacterium]|jgi:DNA-binding response OmpR family regulator